MCTETSESDKRMMGYSFTADVSFMVAPDKTADKRGGQIEQLKEGLRKARSVLGHDLPGLTDEKIQESLWYYYFDLEKTINYILSKTPREMMSRAYRLDCR